MSSDGAGDVSVLMVVYVAVVEVMKYPEMVPETLMCDVQVVTTIMRMLKMMVFRHYK